jgi:group I intron endonuclease
MNVGYIYKLISPSGKKYIGQTITSVEKRWSDHQRDAEKGYDSCPLLANAIRKYGFANFVKETLLICPIDELDANEIKYIKEEGSLKPNGYNALPGGKGGYIGLTDELAQFKSNALRKHTEYELPPGLVQIKCGNINGFKVIICDPSHAFVSKHQTMEQKLKDATECYNIVKNGGKYERQNNHKWNKELLGDINLPRGISYCTTSGSVEVKIKVNGAWHRRVFTRKSMSVKEKCNAAIEYLTQYKLDNNITN